MLSTTAKFSACEAILFASCMSSGRTPYSKNWILCNFQLLSEVTQKTLTSYFVCPLARQISDAGGNRYVIILQDFLTNWPLVFPAPDQKAI